VLSSDAAFDDQLPSSLQFKASMYFTPLEVARRAAILLAPDPGMTVLDVGAGVGKFCFAAAMEMPFATFIGVEWREHLVTLANELACKLKLANTRFIHANALDLDWSTYDAFYFFNPFAEQLYAGEFVLDDSIALDPANFDAYVIAVRDRLSRSPIGTRIVTYHGFGAFPPLGYEQCCEEGLLELWIKRREFPTLFHFEDVA
jgi:hypothetical protein